jgi:hypothetical protein
LSIYIGQNDFISAEKYIKEAEKLITSQTPYNQGVIQVFMQTAFHYLNVGDFKKGSYYLQKYSTLKDSTFNERLTTNLMKIEAEHLEKENKAKIETQNKILALNQQVMVRQKYLNVFVGIVALLLVIITIMLVKSNRQKQRINSLLDKKVRERTQQLESNRDELQRACEERDILINKTSIDIRNALATIRGLCGVALKDIQDPTALQYMAKVDAVGNTFSGTLSRLQLSKSANLS